MRSWQIKIVDYHHRQSIPQHPNLETCLCLIFITSLLNGNFFSIYFTIEVAHQNLIWLDCFWFFAEKEEDQTNFWVYSWQNIESNQYVQVNCMTITSSLWPIQLFQAFNWIVDTNILILVAKKNTLKARETVKYFSHIFYHGPSTQSPVWCSDTT